MTRYLSLAEYVWLAEQMTGVESAVLMKAARLDLADSALHAPSAGFEDQDFYPDIVDKAAVLTCRLAWNHPLPDGKRMDAGGVRTTLVRPPPGGRRSDIAWMVVGLSTRGRPDERAPSTRSRPAMAAPAP